MPAIEGVLFDKDGTLFDFHSSWSAWTRRLLDELAGGDDLQVARMGAAVGFDAAADRFAADCPVVSGTPDDIALRLLPHLPGASLSGLVARMNMLAAEVPLQPATPLVPLFTRLRADGLRLGLATNDGEAPARAHMARAGLLPYLDFIAGFDSGHGGKPAPGMMLAFCAATGLRPAHVLMVGDSLHDLAAGRAAGMQTLGVLTGPAGAEALRPLADAILPDIGRLPEWIAAQAAAESVR